MIKLLEHFGKYLLMLKGMFTKPENARVYWKEFIHQCNEIGIGSMGIVVIISLFLGAVTTIQTAYQLISPLVQKYVIAQIIRDSTFLELSPTVVCIVLAGVVGSKIASELGNMRVSEQIDALEIMGINTKTYLILPKILASFIVIPCLITISMFLSIWGGYLAGTLSGIMNDQQFTQGLTKDFVTFNLTFGLIKAFTFAFIISSISAYFGYNVKGGALEIGRASTTSVVVSCILILFADYGLAALLL
ncbi:MAG: ABC transporter permease [Bacteroidetes bacterium]|jgi:phospholipid/cholesterol/gamma-HCH transport system permease protein|nr:ABC transporter permease [Bacteroidota bacterium]MBK8145475.1 ABC transporter permease [Bacteroidota bacterium]MBP6315941.1 ABC transporter permease [Chitinophagaceae bacterium]